MVKLRMTRLGKKKRPFYRIIAIDSRKRRDGDFIERLGFYDPLASGKAVRLEIDAEKAIKWLLTGAQVSPTVKNIFSNEGIMLRYDMIRRFKKERVESTDKNGKKIVKYTAVKDEQGNFVRLFTDAQVDEAFKNFLAAKEKKSTKKVVEKKVLSKKAKAKIEAEKKAAEAAKNAPKAENPA